MMKSPCAPGARSSAAAHCGAPAGRLPDDSAWRRVYTAERWRKVLRTGAGEEAFSERLRAGCRWAARHSLIRSAGHRAGTWSGVLQGIREAAGGGRGK